MKEEREQALYGRKVLQAKATSAKACPEAGASLAHLWKGRRANETRAKQAKIGRASCRERVSSPV